jgi:hypothetical protein
MCSRCGWSELVTTIETHLEQRMLDHPGVILSTLSDVIAANQHVTPEQREAAETVIEQYTARFS